MKGEEIKQHFEGKRVGSVDAWAGKPENIPLYIFSMKEPDYVMIIMSTYGTLNEVVKAIL